MRLEAESDCVQVLVQVDGREDVDEDRAGGFFTAEVYDVSQDWTDVYFGTDQQGFCGGDLHVSWVEVTFLGLLVTEDDWIDGL